MPARQSGVKTRQRGKPRRPVEPAGRGTGAGRSPSPVRERLSLLRHRGLWILLVALAAVAYIVVAVLASRDGGTELEQRTAELEAQEAARHAEQVTELTDATIIVHAELLPVMAELHELLPVDRSPGEPASAAEVAEWQAVVDGARAEFGDPSSASTELNSTRGGLVLAVDLLRSALTAYESALAADGDDRSRLEGLAADLRMNAVDAWSVAALQLDLLNIDVGNGHVHLYLPARPGDEMVLDH